MSAAATSTGVYVYGIVRADALAAVQAEGVAAEPVELIERDGLAAVVSRLPERELRVKRRDLNRHLQVLEEAFAETTVVPCPFGTVLQSEEDVVDALLVARRGELTATLKRLDGNVQLNVNAVYDEQQLLRELLLGQHEIAALRDASNQLGDAGYYARVRLGELVATLVDERRQTDAERVLSQLLDVAEDVVTDQPGEDGVLKASFLVNRKRVDRFDARLEETARMEHPLIKVEVIGPLPPTAFAGALTER
jgi:hypothetical protein